MLTNRLVKKSGHNPLMMSSGKATSTNSKIAILMTRLNNPKVRILIGQVIVLMIGLIRVLINPNKNPAKARVRREPLNHTSDMK